MTKIKAKQIDKLLAGFIYVPSITINSGTSNKVITTALTTALTTAGFNGTSVPNVRSSNEITAGLIVAGSNNENTVLIDTTIGTKITNINRTVFGKLTWNGSDYVLGFYYINNAGAITSYTLPSNYNVTLKIPYRFKLEQLSTDVIIKIKQWWLNENNSGDSSLNSSWEANTTAIENITGYSNGVDIGCYANQSIYEFNSSSVLVADGDLVLKPNNILSSDPGRWLKKLVIGSVIYNNNNPSTATNFEGIPVGSTFTNKTMQEMWDMLLYPYQYPSFSNFSVNIANILEVGAIIAPGNKTFTWNINNSSNLNPNSISISGPGFTTVTGLANDGTEAINFTVAVTQNTPTTSVWTITGTNTKNQQFNKTYTVNWRWSVYYGESSLDSLTSNDIIGLRASSLVTTVLGSWNYVYAEQKYKYICYPSDWVDPVGYKRADNGLSVPGSILPDLISVTKNGVTKQYKVWRSYEKLEGQQIIIAY